MYKKLLYIPRIRGMLYKEEMCSLRTTPYLGGRTRCVSSPSGPKEGFLPPSAGKILEGSK